VRHGLTPAFVLHRRPYRNSSALLELLTLGSGRVAVVARGLSRPGARLGGTLQLFVPLLVGWVGRGELGTLTGAEDAGSGPRLPASRLAHGLYLNELLVRLLGRHDSAPELFACYQETLTALATGAAAAPILRRFERALLASQGLGLALEMDSGGSPVEPGERYRYDPESGPVRLAGADPGVGAVAGASLLAFALDQLELPATLRDALKITRLAIDHQLGGRPLRSRELMRPGRRSGGPAAG